MIKANCQLYELDLSENAFGEIAIQALATFLTSKSCHSLKELRLNNNGLGITGGKALAAALTTAFDASNKTLALKVFIAGRNRLEDAGTSALAAVFEQMKSLEEIQMPQNGIRLPGIKAMFEALSANRALKIINFNDNTIKPDGCTYVSHALTKLPLLEKLDLGDCLLQQTGKRKFNFSNLNQPLSTASPHNTDKIDKKRYFKQFYSVKLMNLKNFNREVTE